MSHMTKRALQRGVICALAFGAFLPAVQAAAQVDDPAPSFWQRIERVWSDLLTRGDGSGARRAADKLSEPEVEGVRQRDRALPPGGGALAKHWLQIEPGG